MTKKIAIFGFLILVFSTLANAQNIRFDDVANQQVFIGGVVSGLKPIPSAIITVCTVAGTGTPCTPVATNVVCSSSSDSTCSQPNPFNADASGNYGAWLKPGRYKISITGIGITGYLKTYDLPIGLFDSGVPALNAPSVTGGLTVAGGETVTGGILADIITDSGLTVGNCVQASIGGKLTTVSGPCGTSSGTITATGSPAAGNLTKFSGATSVTNADLTGDVSTSGGVATTLATVATAATNTKITYNAKGLVTSGVQAQFSDIGGTVTDGQLANPYSGTGGCAGGQFVNNLNRNGGPNCSTPTTGVTEGVWSLGGSNIGLVAGAGACPSNIAGCSDLVFVNTHTLIRLTYWVAIGPNTCGTNAVVGVQDITSSSTLASSTVNASSGSFVDSGAISVVMTAGHRFDLGVVTGPASCTTAPTIRGLTAVYQ